MRSNTFPSVLLALVVAGWVHGRSEAQDTPSAPKPAETAAPAAEVKTAAAAAETEAKPAAPETPPPVVPEGMLMLNFRGAPLESVLNYLSDAAGYIIVTESEIRGKLDVISKQPVTKDEAFTILESALARNGYTALRNGRTLTIVSKEGARKRDIPVKSGNDPEAIPKDEQMVTQIIPVRFISATQLTTDLQPLLPSEATMTANDAGNALVITDTQSSIRRLAEIIRALDTSLAGANSVKVYALRFADAKEVATVIKELYPAQDSRTTGGNTGRGGAGGFGGFPGFAGGGAMGGGGRGGAAASSGGGNRAAASRVVAVADEHSNSLIVNAPEDAMPAIEELIRSIDTNVQDVTELRVFRLQNSDPVEMAEVLAGLFPDPTTSTDRGQNRFGGFGMFGGGGGRGNGATTTTSERAKKKGRVITVPDQRTSSIIVSADHEMMDQIAEMVKQLDTNPARKQKVYVYDLQNADPQQVQEVLRGLFESQSTANRSSQTRNQQNSALSTRSTQQQNSGNRATTGFGGGGGGGGGGAGGGGGGVGGR